MRSGWSLRGELRLHLSQVDSLPAGKQHFFLGGPSRQHPGFPMGLVQLAYGFPAIAVFFQSSDRTQTTAGLSAELKV